MLCLADLKGGMEFTLFRGLPHLLCPIAGDRDGFIELMEMVCGELTRRMELYGDREIESLKRWNTQHPDQRMQYIVVVDELAEVTSKTTGDRDEQQKRRRAVQAISQVARLGRAVGIHMILCTQRPDAEIVEGQAKSNMGATLAFRTRDAIQSQILLGPGDVTASQLPAGVPGRGIWKWIDAGIQVQTPLLEVERARELLARIKQVPPNTDFRATSSDTEVKSSQPVPGRADQMSEISDDCEPAPDRSCRERATFDVTRLAVGRRYEFTLADGRAVVGVLRALEASNPDDGKSTMWVCDGPSDHYLDRGRVVSARQKLGTP